MFTAGKLHETSSNRHTHTQLSDSWCGTDALTLYGDLYYQKHTCKVIVIFIASNCFGLTLYSIGYELDTTQKLLPICFRERSLFLDGGGVVQIEVWDEFQCKEIEGGGKQLVCECRWGQILNVHS